MLRKLNYFSMLNAKILFKRTKDYRLFRMFGKNKILNAAITELFQFLPQIVQRRMDYVSSNYMDK